MPLELRHLRVLCTIAATGSIGKAATALGIAQPSLTAQLHRVERMVGGQLFVRGRRGADPTPLGRLLLDRARLLLPAAGALQYEAVALAGDRSGAAVRRYRIGVTGGPVTGGLVRRLLRERPEPEMTLRASYHLDELAGMLVAGTLDYAVVGVCGDDLPSSTYGLVWRTVAVDAVCALLPEDDALADRDEIALADLHDRRWVAGAGDGCFTACFAAACARAGFIAADMVETDICTALELVTVGNAVGLCQGTFRPPPGMVHRPLAGTSLRWRHLLGWHPDSWAAAQAARVVEDATAAYLDNVERNPRYARWLRAHQHFGVQDAGRHCPACRGPSAQLRQAQGEGADRR